MLCLKFGGRLSHPSWVCGLKLSRAAPRPPLLLVTPFVGVWIETDNKYYHISPFIVTPFVGVWIETKLNTDNR